MGLKIENRESIPNFVVAVAKFANNVRTCVTTFLGCKIRRSRLDFSAASKNAIEFTDANKSMSTLHCLVGK